MPNNETILYGIFENNLWRDEKKGTSFFRMKTKQELFLKQMYQSTTVLRNPYTDEDETWYMVICDASDICCPSREKGSPIMISGEFLNTDSTGQVWDFKVSSVKEATNDINISIEYLSSESFEDISEEDAIKIINALGPDIYDWVKKDNIIDEIHRITDLEHDIVKRMIRTIERTSVERETFEFLSQFNIPYPYSVKAVKFYGNNALNKIKCRPYFTGEKLGLKFNQCDAIAKHCGFNSFSSGRIKMAARDVAKTFETAGNVYSLLSDFEIQVNKKLNNDSYSCIIPIENTLAIISDEFSTEIINGNVCIYRQALVEAEKRIATNIKRLCSVNVTEPYSPNLIAYASKACNMQYGNQQRQAFSTTLSRRGVKIITGGPGTGKTTTIKGMLLSYQKMHPDHTIRLAAPTGRAAQRMSESTGMPAITLHKLAEYVPYGDNITHKDANNPIIADLIVLDEMSMADIIIFDILLEAVKTGTSVWIVGDIHQLESVGPGAILHDLLLANEALIPRTMLTEVFRQKGGSPIIENAERINNGITDLEVVDDFQVITTNCADDSLDKIIEICKELYNPDNPFQTQVLCPARKGVTGIDNLNKELHDLLNYQEISLIYGNSQFRKHDKIIMKSNNYVAGYYNGDIGIVKKVQSGCIMVAIRDVEILLTRDMLDDIELAYAMTIHKSQGSEFENVIVVMPMDPQNMLVRNLLYTGITRAKVRVYIMNESSAMFTAIKVDKSGNRNTMLAQYL